MLECSSSLARQIATPLQEILCEAGELVNVGLEHGKAAMRNLVKAVEQQTEGISLGEAAALKLPGECYKDIKKLAGTIEHSCTLTPRSLANKIIKLGDGILDEMEIAGGHTLERHVARTNEQLIGRVMKTEIKAAGTFLNKRLAILSTRENLLNNVDSIVNWLSNGNMGSKSFDFVHGYSIGKGALNGKKTIKYDLMVSRVVLERRPSDAWGFIVLTSFPLIT